MNSFHRKSITISNHILGYNLIICLMSFIPAIDHSELIIDNYLVGNRKI
jgi:hypothetical protein